MLQKFKKLILLTIPNRAHGQYIRFYMNPCEGGSESEGYYYTQPFNCYVQLYPSKHSHQWSNWDHTESRCTA